MMVVVGMRLMTTMTMVEFEHKDSIIKDDNDDAGKSDNERKRLNMTMTTLHRAV